MTEIDYCLLAFLRFRVIKNNKKYAKLRSKYNQLNKIFDLDVELTVLEGYRKILVELVRRYGLAREKDFSCMLEHRQIFASILTDSNTSIVSQHMLGV